MPFPSWYLEKTLPSSAGPGQVQWHGRCERAFRKPQDFPGEGAWRPQPRQLAPAPSRPLDATLGPEVLR